MNKTLLKILLTLAVGFGPTVQAAANPPPLKGEVLETRAADPYVYLRLKTKDGETWAAVMKAPVRKGEQVTIVNPMTMTNFKSQTLGRTFDTIVFGTLAGAPGSAAPAPGSAPMGPLPSTAASSFALQERSALQCSSAPWPCSLPK